MKDFNNIFPKKGKRESKVQELVWESKVKGTPAAVEALFKCIEDGRTETSAFKWGLNYCRLTEEKLFNAYEIYLRGEVAEEIKWLNRRKFVV